MMNHSHRQVCQRICQVESIFLGRCDFHEMDEFQKKKIKEIKASNKVQIFGMDFNSAITLGLRARKETDLMGSENLPIFFTDRGGFATIHSPGQLVIYPMIDLRNFDLGIKKFIDILFLTTQDILRFYGVTSFFNIQRPGLYTERGKISFVGIKVDQGIVRHGISINISNDLELFKLIRSCGISCQAHDRVSNYFLKEPFPMEDLFQKWVEAFKINLDFNISK